MVNISQLQDFDDFCRDRIETVRVWRSWMARTGNAVGGAITDLEPAYCVRGLEPYQSSQWNRQFHAQRVLHHRAVSFEQERQHTLGIRDPERMRQTVEPLSAWAVECALNLGLQDQAEQEKERLRQRPPYSPEEEEELQHPARKKARLSHHHRRASTSLIRSFSTPSVSTTTTIASQAGTCQNSVTAADFSFTFAKATATNTLNATLPILTLSLPPADAALSLGTSSTTTSTTMTQRFPVDVDRLKQMNAQFLQSFMTNAAVHQHDHSGSSALSGQSQSADLWSLFTKSMSTQGNAHDRELLAYVQPSGNLHRRHSMDTLTTTTDQGSNSCGTNPAHQLLTVEPPFFIRRDSLHGLNYHQNHHN